MVYVRYVCLFCLKTLLTAQYMVFFLCDMVQGGVRKATRAVSAVREKKYKFVLSHTSKGHMQYTNYPYCSK